MSAPELDTTALPWHAELWQQLTQTRRAGRMAHGLLLYGPPGTGRRQFAARLAKALVCHAPQADGDACGSCPGCHQWHSGAHPDVSMLVPEEGSSVIKVDLVRAFTYKLQLTSQYATGRLGWIEPAEQLNNAAANSLLKTLEEPPAGTHLLLVTSRVDRLLPTIRSRCRILRVPPAPVAMARDWLEAQGVSTAQLGADELRMPLRQINRDPELQEQQAQWRRDLLALLNGQLDAIDLADRWHKQPAPALFEWLYRTLDRLLAAQLQGLEALPEAWRTLPATIDVVRLQALCAGVIRAGYLINTNADWQLVLETVLAEGAPGNGRI